MANFKKRLLALAVVFCGLALVLALNLRSKSEGVRPEGVAPSVTKQNVEMSPEHSQANLDTISVEQSHPDSLSAQTQLKTLDQILTSKNDNDPRLDTELKVLSEEAKKLFMQKYQSTHAEQRNERGTIVFLLGRNLKNPQDFEFLKGVINEPPCLSLAQCSQNPILTGHEDHHLDSVEATTLAYPQLVALKSLEKYLDTRPSVENQKKIRELIEAAKKSPVSKVSELARALESKLP